MGVYNNTMITILKIVQDDFIRREGYPVERHTVITTDGYNLTVHRIPYSKNEDPSTINKKPAVLVQHGILCSSTDWVISGQNSSLGECVTNRCISEKRIICVIVLLRPKQPTIREFVLTTVNLRTNNMPKRWRNMTRGHNLVIISIIKKCSLHIFRRSSNL